MKIPNAERAIVDIGKLRDYCLNSEHNDGKHKARLFSAALGMGINDAEALREALLQAVQTANAQLGKNDVYGQRYTIDFTLHWHGRQATIRSGWIIDRGSEVPRLVTAYPL
jgi:hypothetical protein